MHLKRHKVPKNWPIKRKGTTYVVRPNANLVKGIPILIGIRDILKFAQNKKEVKKIIHSKNILLNGAPIKDEKNSITLFDVLTIVPLNEHYLLSLSQTGKFQFEKIGEKESKYKIAKIINKRILKRKKIQLNLSDGRNFISNIKCYVNDSVLIDLKKKKVEKCIPLKEKAKVLVFAGKYAGTKAIIKKVDLSKKMAELETSNKQINVLIKQLIVIE